MKYVCICLLLISFNRFSPATVILPVSIGATRFQQPDTIKRIKDLADSAIYKTSSGRYLKVRFVSNPADMELEEKEIMVSDGKGNMTKATVPNKICDSGENFDGVYRKLAKLSVVIDQNKTLNVADLNSLLKKLKLIKTTGINVNKNSNRAPSENKKVTVSTAFLYAIARESDEDYHIILGTTRKKETAEFFNVECSGLPPKSSAYYTMLKSARKKLVSFLNGEVCKVGYTFFDDMPKVKVAGSLFYDKEHETSLVGPTGHKPKTAWELHPITEFVLL